MKTIEMTVKTTTNKKGTEVVITRNAKLDADKLSFDEVNTFNNDVEKLNKLLKTAIKTEAFTEFDIVTYEYDTDNKGYYTNMKGEHIEDGTTGGIHSTKIVNLITV